MVAYPVLALLVLIPAAGSEPAKPEPKPKSKLPISKETTFITEPLTEDGYVDYAAALNKRLRGNTTPETNVVAGLCMAIGPSHSGVKVPDEFFAALGIPRPPEQGEYIIRYFETRQKVPVNFSDLNDRLLSKPWKADEAPRFAKWLKANDKPLSVAVEAIRRPDYYHPVAVQSMALLPEDISLIQYRSLANLLAMRAMLKCGEGQFDEAWADIMAIHRLGRLIARASTIELLVGIAVGQLAHRCELAFIAASRPDAKTALKRQADLLTLPPWPSMADKVNLNIRVDTLAMLQDQYRNGSTSIRFRADSRLKEAGSKIVMLAQDWDHILRETNRWIDDLVVAAKLPTRLERTEALAEINTRFGKLLKQEDVAGLPSGLPDFNLEKLLAKSKDHVPAVILSAIVPAITNLHDTLDRAEQTSRHGPLAFALAAYHADHGKYPAKLAELSPKYLKEVPDDLFSGKPLIYKPSDDGYLLYSVGVNGKDDGGKNEGLANRELDDLVLRSPSK